MPLTAEIARLVGIGVHAANLVMEWLLTYAIHSTILIGGLLLLTATSFGRRLVAGHGTWAWRFALVGGLITASLQSLRTASPLAGTLRLDRDTPTRTMVRVEVERGHAATTGHSIDASGTPLALLVPRLKDSQVTTTIDVNPIWPLVILGAWLVIAAALVGYFLIARGRFLRFVGPRTSAEHTLAGNALRHLQREGHIDRRIYLTLSERLTSPVALGDDEICLPARALAELDPIRMESILAHEMAHLVRRDPSWLTAARVLEAFLFFQPLNAVARRRMQEAAEFASDAWASTRVSRPLDLAHCLARVAEWTTAAPRLPVPAMAERRGTVLVRRVERLTSGNVVNETTPGRGARLAAAGALVSLVLLAPRAAVGAEQSPQLGGAFTQRVDEPANIVMFRRIADQPTGSLQRQDIQAEMFIVGVKQ